MTRGLVTASALLGLALAPGAGAQPSPVVLDGTFAMQGTVTTAIHIKGEHRGERIRRTWLFRSSCGQTACQAVDLFRLRGSRQSSDIVLLRRTGPIEYTGHSHFWVSLYCAHRLRPHGGRASETIGVHVLHAALVNGTWYATSIRATYVNPRRVNRTRCPGGIGHDAAAYAGTLASPLPGPVTATS